MNPESNVINITEYCIEVAKKTEGLPMWAKMIKRANMRATYYLMNLSQPGRLLSLETKNAELDREAYLNQGNENER